jgi:peptide-methionine (S)-S-oxide reductase
MEKATFAAGCFWHVEDAFRQVKGVKATRVGYTGGFVENPTYHQVCTDSTGHAEAVEVTYDPETVGYDDLLEVFWKNHDPTQVNRQGPDVGVQYRSAVFANSDDQLEAAQKSKARLEESGAYARPIATEVRPAAHFYEAEDYHQQYFEKRGISACHL